MSRMGGRSDISDEKEISDKKKHKIHLPNFGNTVSSRRFRFLPGDAVICVVIALFCAAFILGIFLYRKQDDTKEKYVKITVNGEVFLNHPMSLYSKPQRYVLPTKDGQVVIDISSEEARISQSDCPDQICVKQGALKKIGDGAVCLPNRIVVQIVAGEKGEDSGIGSADATSGILDDSGKTPDAVAR